MRYLVSRTAGFQDRDRWGPNVDSEDEVQRVHARGRSLPAWIKPVATRWFQLVFGLRLLSLSRQYDAMAVGRHGVWLPILLRILGIRKRVIMMDTEWPGSGSGLMNHLAATSSTLVVCNTKAEIERYSREFRIPTEKFSLVPMAFQSSDQRAAWDGGYVFAGGVQSRDWDTFTRAVDGLPYPVKVLADRKLPYLPANTTMGFASRKEFYGQVAGASCVVVPIIPERLRVTGITTWTNAMAMGKVVIVTDPEGASDYMEHGVSGFYVNYGDVEGLRRCIDLVMRDPLLRKRVGQAAQERAWKEFSPEAFRRRVLRLMGCKDPHTA